MICSAAHSNGNVETACSEGEHTDSAARRGVAVRADQRLSGSTEALEVYLMADAVSGTREVQTVLLCRRLDEAVVVGVFKARLKSVVVYVCDRELGGNARDTHSLEFKVSKRSGRVLSQGLVDAESYLLSCDHLAGHQMVGDYFLCNSLSHFIFYP